MSPNPESFCQDLLLLGHGPVPLELNLPMRLRLPMRPWLLLLDR